VLPLGASNICIVFVLVFPLTIKFPETSKFPLIVPPVNPRNELEPYSKTSVPSYPNNFLSTKLDANSPARIKFDSFPVVPVGILPTTEVLFVIKRALLFAILNYIILL